MRLSAGILTVCVLGLTGSGYAHEINQLKGDWRTVRHNADVRIEDCGDGTPCGFLLSVSEEVRGSTKFDERNKEPSLRNRPLIGLPILWGYQRGENRWEKGHLYNPETGQTFRSSLEMISNDRIKMKGCLGPFCRQQIWTRIDHPKATDNETRDGT